MAEIFLRATHQNESSIETRNGIYTSPYHSNCKDMFYEYSHNDTFYLESPEFKYLRYTNSLGITGPELSEKKVLGDFRILALGDSYTDGDGADYDSSYVRFLERKVKARFPACSFSFINAGICGSDPVFNYYHLQEKFLVYKPDLVLVNISSGDVIADEIVRGGMERFAKGKKVTYRKAPWWEPFYAVSYLLRLIANRVNHIDLLLLTPKDYETQKSYLDSINIDIIARFSDLGVKNHFITLFLLRPFKWEISKQSYDFDFSAIQKAAAQKQNVAWHDMMPDYLNEIKQSGKTADYLFWPQNGHHNSMGYEVMAAVALTYTQPLINCDTFGVSKDFNK